MTLDHTTLRTIGTACYGENSWQTPLAADLGVGLRTMQRWASGRNAIPGTIWPELAAICETRGVILRETADRLWRAAKRESGATTGPT
jgi:hypothetical protein